MRIQHFERFQPLCPNCLTSTSSPCQSKLLLARMIHQAEGHVLEGILQCSNRACSSEFPIIDGVPIILSQLRSYMADNLLAITMRSDFAPEIESLIGDCCSQSSVFDSIRQHVSCYSWDHYGQFDPERSVHEVNRFDPRLGEPCDSRDTTTPAGSIVRLLDEFVAREPIGSSSDNRARSLATGLTLDLGCSVGRNCFELAERTGDLVLGIDMNIATLRVAAQLLRTGRLDYPLRRQGVVYDRRTYPIHFARADLVDFWLCDALCLPLASQSVSNCVAFNLLDAVSSPVDLLRNMARVMQTGGHAVVACPYDWSVSVTPIQSWLGGHSQRSAQRGDPVAALRYLINEYESPAQFSIDTEIDRLPWRLRLHERSSMSYEVHGMRLVRNPC